MKDVKFRAFCEVETDKGTVNKIIYFEPMECDNGLWFNAPDNAWHINEYFRVMQWTGLKDRNGVDIYEGDVVKHHLNEKHYDVGSIDFSNGSFWIVLWNEPAKQILSELVKYDFDTDGYKTTLENVEITGKIAQIT